jgi:hypothetical protein
MINVELVKHFIQVFRPDRVNIFSFAIWNQHELTGFTKHTRPMLEASLGITLNLVPTVDTDIIPVCCKEMGLTSSTVDFQECSNFWSKQGAFRLFMRHHAKNLKRHGQLLHAILLDDAVYDETLTWNDHECTASVSQLNIDRLNHDDIARSAQG